MGDVPLKTLICHEARKPEPAGAGAVSSPVAKTQTGFAQFHHALVG